MDDAIHSSAAHAMIKSPTTLDHLPPNLQNGLIAVSCLGILSLVCSAALCFHFLYRFFFWSKGPQVRANQFVVLIFNLILADIQQSVAFMMNIRWVTLRSIVSGSPECWAQGWFVSTGDLSSGIFTLAIAVHSLADIVFDYRVSKHAFRLILVALWTFNYACAGIGLALHPKDLYTRAGAWCWISSRYLNERFWLHYLWIIMAEFLTVVIYLLIFIILCFRVKSSYYITSTVQQRAQSAAKLIIAYPTIYVVCTLPLVIARLKTMAGVYVSYTEFCVAAAMITSCGWLDTLLYSLTRHNVLFGSEIANDRVRALDTFPASTSSNWRADRMFGTSTTIEATKKSRNKFRPPRAAFDEIPDYGGLLEKGSGDQPRPMSVKAETTVRIDIEQLDLGQMEMLRAEMDAIMANKGEGGNPDCIKGKLSFDSTSILNGEKGEEKAP
ncbi:hypothetical protein CKM354_000214300 [Cercospora kikuchii]|uniref:G protein-coupled receptor GPR1/2/3 C-terminal domain-containing protein n=1 Tax=Cercospora kikuchii TaxID=84275 RepID=A0A9P3C723_9PEZI|nr:uncharacterized protein CKM354_000214300 [Cercospora kikuchii]GIZ38739.1 hypothetical protein CKM354_000214300 [Cercospora kikuchii]